MAQYLYQELAPGHIRLILVSVKGPDVTYKLLHVDLNQAPAYSALSYTWDGQEPTDTILCESLEVKVTPNVRIVLSELASITEEGDHYIWIDGVCINQTGNSEKSIQVAMMQKIYARASNVIIWLGTGSPSMEDAMDSVADLTTKLDGFDGRLGFEPDVLAAHNLPALGSAVWSGLFDILSHNWFTRVWVFQEAVLAKEAWIMCGRKTVAFEIFAAFATKLVSSSASALIRGRLEGENVAVTRGVRSFQEIALYRRWAAIGRRITFMPIVAMGESLLAKDPRDKIYGFLGIADEQTRNHFTPDYDNEDMVGVYIKAGKYFIETEPVLNILHLVSHDKDEGLVVNLPSWCPNFNVTRKASKLGIYSTGRCAGFKNLKLGVEEIPKRASILEGTDVLLIEGCRIDTIKATRGPAWRWWDEPPETEGISSSLQSLLWDDQCFELSLQRYGEPEVAVEAHSRTLVADVIDGKRCTSSPHNLYRSMRDMLELKAPEKTSSPELIKRVVSMTASHIAELETYTRCVTTASRNRVFFSTENGRIGLGPSSTQLGDFVYIIRNTWTPFILRPFEGSHNFHLVGEAYVNGLMYGEAFDMVSEDGFESVKLE